VDKLPQITIDIMIATKISQLPLGKLSKNFLSLGKRAPGIPIITKKAMIATRTRKPIAKISESIFIIYLLNKFNLVFVKYNNLNIKKR
jgi:hypothetical protein